MKILMVTTLYPAYEGHSIKEISYALHNFAKYWQTDNELIIVRPYFFPSRITKNKYPTTSIINGVRIYNIPVLKIPKFQKYYYKTIIKKLQSLNFRPEKVIAHMKNSFLWAYNIATYFNANFVVGIHNGDLNNINYKKYKKVFDNSYKIACRSKSIKERFLKTFPEYEKKVFVANSGINKDEIEAKEFFENKIELWKNKKVVNILTVSLLQKLKNIDINLKALSKLKYKNWKYTIIGDGEERNYLKNLVEELNLKDKVDFLGMKKREEVLKYMKDSDIFTMVSAPETFGLAYLEAMAKGNIIVGAKGWGIDGIIKDGQNGFLIEPRNVEELNKKMKAIIEMNYINKRKILINTYNTIVKYTEEKMAKEYLKNIE